MSYRARMVALLLVVATVPLGGVLWLFERTTRGELAATVGRLETGAAAELARSCDEVVAHGLRVALAWAVLVLIGTVVLVALLARRLFAPMRTLAAAARAIAGGKYAERVDVGRNDELGEVAVAFNRMAAEIERREEEIRAWNAELQRRVSQRTAELDQAQEQILRSRRMTALGTISAGIAHEINNPLAGIVGLVELLQVELGGDAPRNATLTSIASEARRAAKVVADFQTFVERETTLAGDAIAPTRLVKLAIEGCVEGLRAHGIAVRLRFGRELPPLQGDTYQLQEVLRHLVANAIDAMAEGGTLRVEVEAFGHEAVRIAVVDTGKGIPPAVRERIFDPFFTTKARVGQPGLGLTIAHRLVEAHHGRISVASEEGRGSTFSVVLPAAPEQAHLR